MVMVDGPGVPPGVRIGPAYPAKVTLIKSMLDARSGHSRLQMQARRRNYGQSRHLILFRKIEEIGPWPAHRPRGEHTPIFFCHR